MFCFKCKTSHVEKIGFRAVCETCGFDLHVCKNCKYFNPSKPNSCSIPNTEPVSDREKFNFCEDFFPASEEKEKKSTKDDVAKRLFGD